MWKVRLEHLISTGYIGYRLYLIRDDYDGKVAVVQPPFILKTYESRTFLSHAEALLDDSKENGSNVQGILQAFADAAWEIGIKPKQLEDSRNELKAVRDHLQDMRQLAGIKKDAS